MNLPVPLGYLPHMDLGSMAGHEMRRCGMPALAVLTGTAVALGVVLVVLPSSWAGWLVASALPLAFGMAAAMVAGGEDALELHLTLPTPYPRTLRRRLAVLVGVAAVVLAAVVGVLSASGRVHDPVQVLVDAGSVAILLLGTAVYAAVGSGSPGAPSAVVLTAWLAKLLVLDGALRGSGTAAVVAAGAGLALLLVAGRRLEDSEHLMRAAVA
ncbi:MAG: hypothetical protein L0H64_17675 [Pseudonocardia sp.]|nr:hypothetical protein [Pseudonocardia sp.]